MIGTTEVNANAASTLANSLFIGKEGSIMYDYERKTIRLHDGLTQGGKEVKTSAYRDVATAINAGNANNLVPVSLLLTWNPIGMIVMWAGIPTNIPTGWALCDGTNTTPDLRSRFIIGAGAGDTAYNVANAGGAESYSTDFQGNHAHSAVTDSGGGHLHIGNTEGNGNHTHVATTDSVGSHTHTVTVVASLVPHVHSGTASSSGAHTHSLSATNGIEGDHSHTAQAITGASHPDTVWLDLVPTGTLGTRIQAIAANIYNSVANPFAVNVASNVHDHSTNTQGDHTHPITGNALSDGGHTHPLSVSLSGVDTSHTHTASTSSDGLHSHAVTVGDSGFHSHDFTTNFEAAHVHNVTTTSTQGNHQHTVTVVPPYYALCFIQFIGV